MMPAHPAYCKKLSTTLLMLCVVLLCTAQSVFNRTYIEDRDAMLFGSIVCTDSSYIVTGVTNASVGSYYKSLLSKINSSGDMVNIHIPADSITGSYGLFFNTLVGINGDRYAFTGLCYDTIPYLLFGTSNKQLDSISLYRYYTPNTFAFHGHCILEKNNEYYLSGVRTDSLTNDPNVFLIKVDISGNRLWERKFGQIQYSENGKSIIQLNNGNLMLGAVRNNLNRTNERANTWLIEVDTGGNVVRQWFDPNDSTYAAEGLLQTQDGGFIYGAQKKAVQDGNDVYKTATIVKLDSTFNKQWAFTDGHYNTETAIVDLEELPDGSFVGCGNKPFYNGDSSMISGWVVKLDASGNVLFNRTYAGFPTFQSYNYLTDIDVLPDGSLIAVGQCQKSGAIPPQVGWFLKLDSNGCEVENCLVGIDEPMPGREAEVSISLYPNPCAHTLYIQLSEAAQSRGEVTIEVLNSIGEVMYRQQQPPHSEAHRIDVSAYAQGLYAVVLRRGLQAVAAARFVKQ